MEIKKMCEIQNENHQNHEILEINVRITKTMKS